MAEKKMTTDINYQGNKIKNAVFEDCILPEVGVSSTLRVTLYEIELTNLNFGEVPLSQDIQSFDMIFIYGSTDDYTLVTTIIEPKVGDQFGLVGMAIESGEFMIKTKTYSIQSNSFIPTSIAGLCSIGQGGSVVMMDQYYIGIYKVIGLKY